MGTKTEAEATQQMQQWKLRIALETARRNNLVVSVRDQIYKVYRIVNDRPRFMGERKHPKDLIEFLTRLQTAH